MAASMRRTNHWPTIARLMTDSALCPIVRVSVVQTASPATVVVWLMNMTTMPSAIGDAREHDAASETVDHPADPECADRADQGRPEIDRRVGHPIEAEIREQRLGNQPETLRAARQRAHHGRGGDEEHPPSVEHAGPLNRC